jgi:hypothetical protein
LSGGSTTTSTLSSSATTTTAPGTISTTTVPSSTSSFVPTTSPKFVLPHGAPETGAGGSAYGGSTDFLPIGLIALGLAGMAGAFIVRVRRTR